LIKYWLSVSDDEQERRFQARLDNPLKRWKLSPTDLEARARWVDYAEAKDKMFERTDNEHSPWSVVEADDKRSARLNLISHLLEQIPYERVDQEKVKLPDRQERKYDRPPESTEKKVPERFRVE
jgi:polyphosphate kinase